MSKFKEVVTSMMSGDIDSAADAFVDRLFKKVAFKNKDMALREAMSNVTRDHMMAVTGVGDDDLLLLDTTFDQNMDRDGNLEMDSILPVLNARTGARFPADENYLHDVWGAIQDELEMRQDQMHGFDDQYDQRNYDEEDEAAAWNDRYQQWRNEY